MPRITSKGQITIPREIRNKFGYHPGAEVEILTEGNKAIIIKSIHENNFIKWLGQGKRRSKKNIDMVVEEMRGRRDE